MPFIDSEGTRFFVFEGLTGAGLTHGVFTRIGGISPEPWGSLNAGARVGDRPERVSENLARAARALGRPAESLVGVRQVHGGSVFLADSVRLRYGPAFSPDGSREAEADALITSRLEPTLFLRFADCVPVLIYDPIRRVAGLAHAGWRGTLLGVTGNTVDRMAQAYGSRPRDMHAAIGPAICAAHYEVGPEVYAEASMALGAQADEFIRPHGDRYQFDLRAANRGQLEAAGVRNIELIDECTAENPDRWFSHRGEAGRTGRFAVLAGIGKNGAQP